MSHDIISSMRAISDGRLGHRRPESIFRVQWRIWVAVMLRDMRSRFFGNGLGYIVLLAWPISHMSIVMIMHAFQGTAQIYGDSLMAYLLSGFLPVFVFVYMSRLTVFALSQNVPLLSFPAVKPLDLIIGHSILEAASACLMTGLFFIPLSLAGYDLVPRHLTEAFLAFGTTMLLGFGFGILNGAIALMARPWVVGYNLVVIVIYISSGALIPAENMPQQLREIVVINPVFGCVEWMHSAFLDIGSLTSLSGKLYPLGCGIGSLVIGLALERLFRGRILRVN